MDREKIKKAAEAIDGVMTAKENYYYEKRGYSEAHSRGIVK